MQRVLVWLLAFLLVVGTAAFAQSDDTVFFAEEDCPFPAPDSVICGYLVVPENRAQPDGYSVELPVAIINPDSANPVPVVYLEGGPGGSALLALDSLLPAAVAQARTLIVFDQRGTGFAQPSLNCWELEEGDEDGVQACRDRLLDEGVDLQMYSSAASAADVNDLVRTLGYEQVDLWGISYGTKLGLTVMRDFPEIVRSAVLDSVYAPETDDLQVQITGFLDAIDLLFARCAADADCAAAYPDLENGFYTLLDELDANPVEVESEGELILLDGATLYNALFNTLYDTQAIPFLPYGIDLLAHAQTEDDYSIGYGIIAGIEFPIDLGSGPAESLADSDMVLDYIDEFGQIDDSEGMAYSVDCQEEYQLNDERAARDLAAAAPGPLGIYFADTIDSSLIDCQVWAVQTATGEDQRIRSAIPALLFAGSFDPITPVSSAESALQGLSNGRLLVFPSAGHGITLTETESGACAAALMLAFLDDPGAPLDTGCIAATSDIDFYIDISSG